MVPFSSPRTAAYMEEEEEEETKRALQLILDLVKLSKSHTTASSPTEVTSTHTYDTEPLYAIARSDLTS